MENLKFDTQSKIGILKYNKEQFKIDQYFKDIIKNKFNLLKEDFELENLHLHISPTNIPQLYEALYSAFDNINFYKEYYNLLKDYITPFYSQRFLIQMKPAIRIQYPNQRTVQYHSDEWYGHGPEVYNFWLPLTNVNESNSIYISSPEDSDEALNYLEKSKAIQPEIDSHLRKFCNPIKMSHGEIFCFNSKIIHGTEVNITGKTRISIDFRLLHEGNSSGTKKINEFYLPFHYEEQWPHLKNATNLNQIEYKATSYLYPSNGFTKFFSAYNQRDIIRSFSKKNNIIILAEETEIHTMAHHPTLKSLTTGYPNPELNCIVAFSVLCLPSDIEDRKEILTNSVKFNIPIFFALENISTNECKANDFTKIEDLIKLELY